MSSSHKGLKLKKYTVKYKVDAIEYAKVNGNTRAARQFSVDRKRIIEWRKQEGKLREACSVSYNRSRVNGGGKKPFFPELDTKVMDYIQERRRLGARVTGVGVRAEARRLHALYGNQNFKGSCQWLRRFMTRNKLSFRRRTHVSQKPEPLLSDRMQSFLRYVYRLRLRKEFTLHDICNMDETPIWIDMPGDYTMEFTGTKTIAMASTGQEKTRITVCLAALADGSKLQPYVLLKGVRPPKDIPIGIKIEMTPGSWASEPVILKWLKNVYHKNNSTRRMLVWDSFRAHTTKTVKEAVAMEYNSDMVVIPGGCTSKLQPCDVSWNKPFKDNYRNLYDEWLVHGERELTKGGNRRPPSKTTILQWIKQSWDLVTVQTVKKSFLKCGISVALDGSQDAMLFDESDDEDDFAGFSVTAGEEEACRMEEENLTLEVEHLNRCLDDVNEWDDGESEEEEEDDPYFDPRSPGH